MKPKTGLPSQLGPTGPPLLSDEEAIVPMRRDWMSRSVLLMAVVLLAIAVFGVWLRYRPIPYDAQRWVTSSGLDRGRMLGSLLQQTTFVGFPRTDVEGYLGRPEYDERQFWYDLGPADSGSIPEPRAFVGDPMRLYGVFSYDRDNDITQVLYSRRRPVLGSAGFDSVGWFGTERVSRRTMFTRALGVLRTGPFKRDNVVNLLGPPDGSRIRSHYDVGTAGAFLGSKKALVLDFSEDGVVVSSHVDD